MVKPTDFRRVDAEQGSQPDAWERLPDDSWQPIDPAQRGNFSMNCQNDRCGKPFIRNASEEAASVAVLPCTYCGDLQSASPNVKSRPREP
jgi:hypothetical protein